MPKAHHGKFRALIVFAFLMYFIPRYSVAQTILLRGQVKDNQGNPLAGVTVVEKGTTNGSYTDDRGNYVLQGVRPDATLVFSIVGMKPLEIPVTGKSNVNATLESATVGLNEVVAIGYGTVKKQDLTGAVSSVDGDVIAQRKTARVSQALQGSMPGMMVTRSGGAPDASATVRVRGVTTIGNSDPLVIVDGVPGTLDWVNPNDIESISVLKDAASASIYGARAAAGVILITTKRAKAGQMKLTYNYEYGVDKPTRVAKNADARTYMRVLNERNWNDGGNVQGNEFPIYPQSVIDNYDELSKQDPGKYPNTNWQDLIFRKSTDHQSHRLTLTAGSDKIRSLFSLDYDRNNFLYDGRNYNRIMFRSNNDVRLNNLFSVSIDLQGIYSEDREPGETFSPSPSSYGVGPVYAAMWPDGRVAPGKSGENTYALAKYGGFSKTTAKEIGGKLSLDFTPIKALKITGTVAPELYSSKGKRFTKQIPYTNYDDPDFIAGYITGATSTSLSESRPDNYSFTTQLFANYVNSFGKHNINAMLGFENYYYFSESLNASRENYILSSFPYLDLGNENYQYNSGSAYENAYRSVFGRILYNYNNRYFLQVNTRMDGSSRFAKQYRWGTFPSISAGWAISQESFMKGVRWLSYLKLRGSWGTLGNERIGNYPYQSTIGFGSTLVYQGSQIVSAQDAAVSQYAIPNISWETTETFDIGADFAFLDSRLTATVDYYKKTTRDMLLDLEIPDYIGLDDPSQNTGKMYTKGWGIEASWRDRVGKVRYSASVNLSDSRSVMGDLGGTQFIGSQVKFKGSEFNEWYGYKSDGLFQTTDDVKNSPTLNSNVGPGDVKYEDLGGASGTPDGKISSEYDRTLLGGSLPRYLYGGNIHVGYGSFDFSASFQGVGKQISQKTAAMVEPFLAQYIEVPQLIIGKYWSHYNTDEQNLKARYPRVSNVGNSNNYAFSDYWLFNGAYFRLKSVTLSYNVTERLCQRLRISSAQVYASGTDLFSLDHYPKGWDPEASSYWVMKSIIFGISLGL